MILGISWTTRMILGISWTTRMYDIGNIIDETQCMILGISLTKWMILRMLFMVCIILTISSNFIAE